MVLNVPANILILKQIKMMKSIYSNPKLCKGKKYWYVYFRYNKELFRYKYGINYIHDLKEREKEAGLICEALLIKLKSGWNPNVPDIEAYNSNMTIIEALDFAMEKKKGKIAEKSFSGYTTTVSFFKEAAQELNLIHLPIIDVKRVHVKTIFEKVKFNRSWSNKAYNKNLGYLKAIFSELLQWDIIENNPAHKIKTLSTGETNANVPATDEQIILIKDKLLSVFPNFWDFNVTIFHTGIRPDELLQVKLSMVDLHKREIYLPPEITKTDIFRIVPINNHLFEVFQKMEIEKFDQEFYLFGSNREHSNRGLKRDKDFLPGKNRLKCDCATKLWRKLIKKELNLDVNMYSMKHLGADKKIIAGIDLDSLRELYGHTSKRMTMRYAKVIKDVYRKQIIEYSPAL